MLACLPQLAWVTMPSVSQRFSCPLHSIFWNFSLDPSSKKLRSVHKSQLSCQRVAKFFFRTFSSTGVFDTCYRLVLLLKESCQAKPQPRRTTLCITLSVLPYTLHRSLVQQSSPSIPHVSTPASHRSIRVMGLWHMPQTEMKRDTCAGKGFVIRNLTPGHTYEPCRPAMYQTHDQNAFHECVR